MLIKTVRKFEHDGLDTHRVERGSGDRSLGWFGGFAASAQSASRYRTQFGAVSPVRDARVGASIALGRWPSPDIGLDLAVFVALRKVRFDAGWWLAGAVKPWVSSKNAHSPSSLTSIRQPRLATQPYDVVIPHGRLSTACNFRRPASPHRYGPTRSSKVTDLALARPTPCGPDGPRAARRTVPDPRVRRLQREELCHTTIPRSRPAPRPATHRHRGLCALGAGR